MITAVAFVAAAAVGALARWQLGAHRLPRPAATLLVNVSGAFALGLLDGWSAPELTVVGVGGLGAYTTFSTLADDIVDLGRDDLVRGAAYVAVTLVAGIGAAVAGLGLAP